MTLCERTLLAITCTWLVKMKLISRVILFPSFRLGGAGWALTLSSFGLCRDSEEVHLNAYGRTL